ncbi:hypothetical protein JWG39_02070 [Desulforhopalus vacuolatus]|uniref:hypothetical protein n=1 Tax=Desulforhopalus vacuolatus TaxID=40414 RepID=UPI0019658E9E|nr:hypothetical protein [Desulforhopalus vacuolatus]MBM9518602.1 hypothetical protein [Desulforhopalus vacuolatus]
MKNFEIIVYRLIAGETQIEEFEQWVYSEKKLEQILTSDDYLNLISLSYKQPSSLYEAEKILKRYVDIGKYYEWSLRRVLEKVIDHSENASRYIEKCYDLYCDGYNFLDNLGLGYGLSVVVPPADYIEENEQSRLIDGFYPAVAEEASKVIGWLNSGKIVITGHDGSYQGIEYNDNRTLQEKEPTSYKISSPKKRTWKFWQKN